MITSAFSKAPSVAAMWWLEWGLAADGQTRGKGPLIPFGVMQEGIDEQCS